MRNEKIRRILLKCSVVSFIQQSSIIFVLNIYLVNNFLKVNYLLVLEGFLKHGNKSYDKILGIEIPSNLISCHVFLKNINPVVILKFPKRILKYYFSKGFTLFDCNNNNLAKIPNEVKDRIHAEDK